MLLKWLRNHDISIEELFDDGLLLPAQVVDHYVVELANNMLQLHLNNAIEDGGLICDKNC
jgi:hypothetical protein